MFVYLLNEWTGEEYVCLGHTSWELALLGAAEALFIQLNGRFFITELFQFAMSGAYQSSCLLLKGRDLMK